MSVHIIETSSKNAFEAELELIYRKQKVEHVEFFVTRVGALITYHAIVIFERHE